MKKFKLKAQAVKALELGKRLISLKDLEAPEAIEQAPEGWVFGLADQSGQQIGQAIVGRQNKGFAWLLDPDILLEWSSDFVTVLFEEAVMKRENLLASEDTTAFRLFNGEGDGCGGLTIDYYDHYAVINWYSRGAYQYRQWWIQVLEAWDHGIKGIYQVKRFELDDQESALDPVLGQAADQPLVIRENGVSYAVYLGQSWMTGIFLDQRSVRQFVKEQAQGLKVLNLFSYTGAFSVAAAVGQAEKTVSVDIANRSLEWTRENFCLNQLEASNDTNEIRVMDVFDYIAYAKKHNLLYDFVICDPPSFARSKKRHFSVDKDYFALAQDLFEITRPGGICLLSTNNASLMLETFRQQMTLAGANKKAQLIQQFELPEDFPTSSDPESAYLKVLVFYVP
ncbi:class I SAM-dependent rRNA methyltransferase [Facklamia hominis]|uniref:Class I SAM-dependent rRNA methyltransferase n=1 Tax=Facklamia hominis TaxID=178214 RepID=A0AAJ1Q5H2_9LACT|nr:class I SAM-dependent rRNA methyltransferase [Facklamia hominis]EPH11803.1 hypothetical protein HMPREF9260_00856 [Facklamia hominis ACS-120-V-Sch10]MDK7187810.1 class I SAM-dependent rRNA methyltransferase [Facklamia hominis]